MRTSLTLSCNHANEQTYKQTKVTKCLADYCQYVRVNVFCLHCCMCVMDSPALWMRRVVHTVKFVKPLSVWQHQLYISLNCVEKIHSVGTINNVETSYFTQLKMCYLMTTFRCPSDILITFSVVWSKKFLRYQFELSVASSSLDPDTVSSKCKQFICSW